MKTRTLLRIALTTLLLAAGCDSPNRPVAAPGQAPLVEQVTLTSEVKVVEMVTQTRTPFDNLTPTPTLFDGPLPGDATFTPTPLAVASGPTLAELGVEVVTYRDEWAGFAFDYPASWELAAPREDIKDISTLYTASFHSPRLVTGPKQQEGIFPNQAKMDVSVVKDGAPSLEAAVKQRRSEINSPDSGAKVVAEETLALPSGLMAVRLHMDTDSGPVSELVTLINGNMILMTGMGDLSLFNPVTESLREVE